MNKKERFTEVDLLRFLAAFSVMIFHYTKKIPMWGDYTKYGLLGVNLFFLISGFVIMMTAVIISMIVMFYFAPKISVFIHKHPTFKILALSFLVLIAVLLVIEGVHIDKVEIPKGYIYFAMAFSFAVELLNLKFRKKTVKAVELRSPTWEEEQKS